MGRGMLTFKGDGAKKKKKKSKHPTAAAAEAIEPAAASSSSLQVVPPTAMPTSTSRKPAPAAVVTQQPQPPQLKKGTGKITVSGTVMTGIGTKFRKELSCGDAVIVTTATTQQQEMRVVKMCLSDSSVGLSSAFSQSISIPTEFQIIPKPRNQQAEAQKRQMLQRKEQEEVEQSAFGTFKGTNELVYRERTEHGTYRIQKVGLGEEKSRTELLSMRAKKTSDKYC